MPDTAIMAPACDCSCGCLYPREVGPLGELPRCWMCFRAGARPHYILTVPSGAQFLKYLGPPRRRRGA